ncbi:hypothetical protein VQ643_02560 [Pseudomonas sp. F1_0610]|uniref:WapI family immunity protein n=1 Tax=Pseudomonas sp. F1_0610 TaxID=3114284 RepID=UPI0039C4900F
MFDKNEICLQTAELKALQDGLLRLQKNPDLESQIEFIEPCLGFSNSNGYLQIQLTYGLQPYHLSVSEEPCCFQFHIQLKLLLNG